MTKEVKISITMLVFSFITSVLLFNLRSPSFSTDVEKSIAQYPLPDITLTSRESFSYYSLNEPFETSKKFKEISSQAQQKAKPAELPVVQETPLPIISFIYEGRQRYAIIGDLIVREGDSINGYQIKGIFKDRVLIKDRKGEEKWLKLQDY